MKQLLLLLSVAGWVGCGKKAEQTPVPTTSAPATAEAAGEGPDRTAQINKLTQVLRRFSAENQRVPKSMDELVTAGYLTELPPAPPGKKWVFDEQLRVSLK